MRKMNAELFARDQPNRRSADPLCGRTHFPQTQNAEFRMEGRRAQLFFRQYDHPRARHVLFYRYDGPGMGAQNLGHPNLWPQIWEPRFGAQNLWRNIWGPIFGAQNLGPKIQGPKLGPKLRMPITLCCITTSADLIPSRSSGPITSAI